MESGETLEVPPSPAVWEPNWPDIINSDIWQNEIRPWLLQLRQNALEEKAPIGAGLDTATLESYHYWRGACFSIQMILNMPADMIEANRQIEAQGKTDAFLLKQQEQRTRNRRL